MKKKLIALFIALIGLIFSSVQSSDALTLHGHAQISEAPAVQIVLPGHAYIDSVLGVNTLSYGQVELRPPLSGATYFASTGYITPASTPTDIFTIYGSSTKTVEVLRVWVSPYSDNGGGTTQDYAWYLLRRSATNTGGTSASVTLSKADSTDSSATCTVLTYSANPSALGSSAGQVGAVTSPVQYAGSGSHCLVLFDAAVTGKPITLRGTSEGLAINCNSVTLWTAGKVLINAIIRER